LQDDLDLVKFAAQLPSRTQADGVLARVGAFVDQTRPVATPVAAEANR